MDLTSKPKGRQGFASMSPERVREITRKGAHAVNALGKAPRWNSEQARHFGSLGDRRTAERRRALVAPPEGERASLRGAEESGSGDPKTTGGAEVSRNTRL